MEATKKTVSIGIFAHNEADNIIATLESLAQQDVFSPITSPDCQIIVSVLANGCTDETVPIAEAYLRKSPALDGNIVVIDKPGKSNAWNEFIHSAESKLTDYFVCMDSDITFGSQSVISTLITRLSHSDEAYLAVDVAQKDTLLKPQKTLFETFSLFFSRMMKQGSTAVAGSLYCAKARQLRKIYMPDGLPVEDGFLRAMLVTDLFTKSDNKRRILVVEEVCHYFTPDGSMRSLFRHEERLLIGTFINSVIYGYLWQQVIDTQLDAGCIVAKNNSEQPNWVEGLIDAYRDTHNPLIPRHFYHKYWSRWASLKWTSMIITFPVIVVTSTVKYVLLKKVERRLHHESGLGYW